MKVLATWLFVREVDLGLRFTSLSGQLHLTSTCNVFWTEQSCFYFFKFSYLYIFFPLCLGFLSQCRQFFKAPESGTERRATSLHSEEVCHHCYSPDSNTRYISTACVVNVLPSQLPLESLWCAESGSLPIGVKGMVKGCWEQSQGTEENKSYSFFPELQAKTLPPFCGVLFPL